MSRSVAVTTSASAIMIGLSVRLALAVSFRCTAAAANWAKPASTACVISPKYARSGSERACAARALSMYCFRAGTYGIAERIMSPISSAYRLSQSGSSCSLLTPTKVAERRAFIRDSALGAVQGSALLDDGDEPQHDADDSAAVVDGVLGLGGQIGPSRQERQADQDRQQR